MLFNCRALAMVLMASAIHADTNSTVLNALSADSGNSDNTVSAIKADNVLIQPASVISLREITVSGSIIDEWNSCNATLGDTCELCLLCCPSDKLNGKTTCRPPNDCDVPPKTVIGDWNECHANLGETCNANFVCCVAPGDKLTGKTTCRPTNDCYIPSPNPGSVIGDYGECHTNAGDTYCVGSAGIGDWSNCKPGDTCASSDFICCIAEADIITQKYTCRQKDTGKCSTGNSTIDLPSLPSLSTPMWAGVNSYFLANLPEADQKYVLSALQQAGITVVRVFVTQFKPNGKKTNAYGQPDLEMTTIGQYNDTALTYLDGLLSIVPDYGIKLIIAFHDRWNLDIKANEPAKYDPAQFYTTKMLNKRLTTESFTLSIIKTRKWEIQQRGDGAITPKLPNPDWWCTRATNLRPLLPNNGIKIATGGGRDFEQSIIDQNFNCSAIDIVAIHAYDFPVDLVKAAITKAIKSNKMIVFEEFGAMEPEKRESTLSFVAGLWNTLTKYGRAAGAVNATTSTTSSTQSTYFASSTAIVTTASGKLSSSTVLPSASTIQGTTKVIEAATTVPPPPAPPSSHIMKFHSLPFLELYDVVTPAPSFRSHHCLIH
ncbi:hypothetical protein BCR33DRAFT_837169 [Rhizoclosmatium globosum]|uniref:Glycoside hydrolase n=1 Tax=Rhizoclosmatium globosum TaxID=329046 RepID=A0A1Y2CVK8_9FUNG|nr:hypothetical protein BCR33DRAFT_837169 [Rhizoclosmatium globosum]|eukprot:ORY51048.1 hypothetical protein BCR33DRAFT_837169 [Rhizoclosmatium globosum]